MSSPAAIATTGRGSDRPLSMPTSSGRRWPQWPKVRESRRGNSGETDRSARSLAGKHEVARTDLVAPLQVAFLVVAFECNRSIVPRSCHANHSELPLDDVCSRHDIGIGELTRRIEGARREWTGREFIKRVTADAVHLQKLAEVSVARQEDQLLDALREQPVGERALFRGVAIPSLEAVDAIPQLRAVHHQLDRR